MIETTQFFLVKAEESLRGAQSELINHRYNNRANRSYYACFQAAISALLRHGRAVIDGAISSFMESSLGPSSIGGSFSRPTCGRP